MRCIPHLIVLPLGVIYDSKPFKKIEDYFDNLLIGVIHTKWSSCSECSAVYYIHN